MNPKNYVNKETAVRAVAVMAGLVIYSLTIKKIATKALGA